MTKFFNFSYFHFLFSVNAPTVPLIDPLKDFISKDLNDQIVNTCIEFDGQRLKSENDKNSKAFFFFFQNTVN